MVASNVDKVQVNWALILLEVMCRQAGNIRGAKGISLSPYLYHLYESLGVLSKDEQQQLRTKSSFIRYGLKETEEPEPEDSGSDHTGETSRGRRRS